MIFHSFKVKDVSSSEIIEIHSSPSPWEKDYQAFLSFYHMLLFATLWEKQMATNEKTSV